MWAAFTVLWAATVGWIVWLLALAIGGAAWGENDAAVWVVFYLAPLLALLATAVWKWFKSRTTQEERKLLIQTMQLKK